MSSIEFSNTTPSKPWLGLSRPYVTLVVPHHPLESSPAVGTFSEAHFMITIFRVCSKPGAAMR
jgi:hypothetical protein